MRDDEWIPNISSDRVDYKHGSQAKHYMLALANNLLQYAFTTRNKSNLDKFHPFQQKMRASRYLLVIRRSSSLSYACGPASRLFLVGPSGADDGCGTG